MVSTALAWGLGRDRCLRDPVSKSKVVLTGYLSYLFFKYLQLFQDGPLMNMGFSEFRYFAMIFFLFLFSWYNIRQFEVSESAYILL